MKVLEHGEPFFAKHGPKAVFLGRWVSGLRIASAWLAGMNQMRWPTFLFWNALGGIAWAASIALGVYFLGHVAEQVIATAGPIAAGSRVLALIAFVVWRTGGGARHRRRGRASRPSRPPDELEAFERPASSPSTRTPIRTTIALDKRMTEPERTLGVREDGEIVATGCTLAARADVPGGARGAGRRGLGGRRRPGPHAPRAPRRR